MSTIAPYLFGIVLTVMAVFLILLVLVQRGRGGGLTGALGGVGGSSAFGAKAGDVFTKITIVAATIWIVACVGAAYWGRYRGDAFSRGGDTTINAPNDAEAVGPGTIGGGEGESMPAGGVEGETGSPASETVTSETMTSETAASEDAPQ